MRIGGCPVAVAQWQSTGGACRGFDSQRLPAFLLSSIFDSMVMKKATQVLVHGYYFSIFLQHHRWKHAAVIEVSTIQSTLL